MLRAVHERDGYPTHWPADPERFIVGTGTLAAWVAEAEDEIVGHVALCAADPVSAWPAWSQATGAPAQRLGVIARFYVSPAARGTGAGGALFTAAVADAQRRALRPVLDVGQTNRSAIGFYERRGWRRVGAGTLTLRDPAGATLAMLLYVGPDRSGPVDLAASADAGARAGP